MIQVIGGEITTYDLPKTGTLSSGETVSGYHLLPKETLKEEGWLPLEDEKPDYDKVTQYLQADGYEILESKVVKLYKIIDIPEPESGGVESGGASMLEVRLDATEEALMQILLEGVDE